MIFVSRHRPRCLSLLYLPQDGTQDGIRTMYAVGKSAQVAKEMREYNIDILGISDGPGLER